MKRVSNVFNLGWRSRYLTATAVALAATCVFFVTSALGDAGNPILGTIKGTIVPDNPADPSGGITVYVRGQWNWLSHNSDCNFDRAATGVGIIWNDPQGSGTSPGANEKERVALVGTVTGGTFTLKFGGQTTAAIAYNADATQMDQKLEALSSIGPNNVSVAKPTATQWDVTFIGDLAKTDVSPIQVANKSLTGSGTNVTITTLTNGVPPVFNGFLVANGGISGYVGTSSATPGNPVDRMVHPVDRGNRVEGYIDGTWRSTAQGYTTNAAGDWPFGQAFLDPSPPGVTTAEATAWKGGCGREPLTATPSKFAPGAGPNGEATGLSCGDGTTACAGHPWGSWGYEKNNGLGYSHHFAQRSDLTTVCANFYDVHGGGKFGTTNFQKNNGTKEITVDGNGDNSIDTNAFNIAAGANCFSFAQPPTQIVTHASGPVTIGDSISDRATLSGTGPTPTGSITFKVYAPNSDGTADTTCSTLVGTLGPVNVNGFGDYLSGPFTPSGEAPQIAGTYEWTAAYSGDATNLPSSTACDDPNEQSVVNRYPSDLKTQQKIVIADYAKVTASSGTPTGTVRFKLFNTDGCAGPAFYDSDDVTLVGDPNNTNAGLANTDNATTQPLPLKVDGTYSWLVTYTGNFGSATSSCGTENTAISGNTPGIAP